MRFELTTDPVLALGERNQIVKGLGVTVGHVFKNLIGWNASREATRAIADAIPAQRTSLATRTPALATPPGATLQVNTAPPGGIFNADTFGDNLSSIRFL